MDVTIQVSDERVRDLLATGFEGGCGYWCRIMDYEAPAAEADAEWPSYTTFPLLPGGTVVCRDVVEADENDEEYTPLRLDRAAVERGLRLMPTKAPRAWADFLCQEDDAWTGDTFIQLCLLGDVVYG